MARHDDTDSEFDPTGERERSVGEGLFDETMSPGSAFAHLYRGEIHRMKFWRERLDRTTNWAVTIMAAILTWAFSSPDRPHYIILVGVAAVTMFLVIEARRYRGYDIWRSRVRLLQENVFANALDPSSGVEDRQWRRELSEDYRRPVAKIGREEAIVHRLRRIYLPLLSLLLLAWLLRVAVLTPDAEWPASAAVGAISGLLVTAAVALFYALLAFVAFRPRQWHAMGELRRQDVGAWEDED
ncbi:DUF2270 domain-containing protein [Halomarina halobia]|uniref:DUF2270 domain-containing protein n=1 Tax=Halomarina halobia TaxID=3033386 RepID=A0ABD6A970_9EURY|nr:DUF2270 domain-containing protein [Halomarina sp. PSR21]